MGDYIDADFVVVCDEWRPTVTSREEQEHDNCITGNQFEIIAKAKQALLDSTNIETSPEEMRVLDNFLFRCWQMGWLDKYDDRGK